MACVGVACFAAGCSQQTELEKYQEKGYKVFVTYDANGGAFLERQGATVMDLFKPSNYMDENGVARIKLKEPTDLSRPTSSSSGNVTLTKTEHFFAGWYQTREVRKNDLGKVVSESGAVLQEVDGKYVLEGTEIEETPAYTYSDYWDFATDVIEYQEADGLLEMTLYAAWIPYYQFDYYYRTVGGSEWTYLSSSIFDYKTTNEAGSDTHDKDTIWVPDWKDGKMNHSYSYDNKSVYEFPKVEKTTFVAAYADADCTQKIESSFTHQGTLDLENGQAINRVQNVYFEVEQCERFKIETAEQFSANANLNGIYEIMADLDFKNGQVKWPALFTTNEFNGQIFSVGGESYSFKNVLARYTSNAAKQGGLFGAIGTAATVKDISFETVTMDFVSVLSKSSNASFGLFTGYIPETATVSNVTITDGMVRLGAIELQSAPNYQLNLLANGKTDGVVTTNKIKLQVYGKKLSSSYQYSFVPDSVAVNPDLSITLQYKNLLAQRLETEFVNVNY